MVKKSQLTKDDHIYLVDGSGYIFRAYHALPPLTRKPDGLPVGAVAGFCNMLAKLLADADASHIAIIFDAAGGSFRNEIYADYKANRGAPPEDLVPQFPLVRVATQAFNLPCIELAGYEADDIIATYAAQAAEGGAQVTIVSSDKDLMQMVGGTITMLDTMKNRAIGTAEVQEKFGVLPDRVVDVQALAGDSSDNVPGVPGIGIKTAAELINHYGDLDTLLANAGEIKQNKRRENLLEYAAQAELSRELVYLKRDVPDLAPMSDMALRAPEGAVLIGFLKAMGFNTITTRMAERYGFDADAYGADETFAYKPQSPKLIDNKPPKTTGGFEVSSLEQTLPASFPPSFPSLKDANYEIVTTEEALSAWVARAHAAGVVAVDTETDGLDSMACHLVGVSLAVAPIDDDAPIKDRCAACYIPLAHNGVLGEAGLNFADTSIVQIDCDKAIALLAPLLCDASVLKILHNAKFDMEVLARYGAHITPLDDTMLMSYTLYAGAHRHNMDSLSTLYLGHSPIPIKDLLGKGKSQITFDKVPIEEAAPYAAEDADVTLRLWHYFRPRLLAEKLMSVYATTERPIVPVVCAMEQAGVLIDCPHLARLSTEFAAKQKTHAARIYELAGEEFNIASPKQLGHILFEKLGLEGGKKTRGGEQSTDGEVLETLAHAGFEIAREVVLWRGVAKLRSTYSDALPTFINEKTGRIHTSYSLAATTTGRFSSSEPNLQNIPIRTSDGRRIRESFIADKDNVLLSADYSQIELRVLAHMADIAALKSAFADGLDIHAMTASEIFNVPLADMTDDVRRAAKAINFGIIYGISAFGLAKQLDIPRNEAADYIKSYFAKFPGIYDYMESIKELAHKYGYVETLFGRRIHLREIESKMAARRAFAERAAINAPIQGTAADIIRRAMVAMPPAIKDIGETQMLMQVHDELVFETPEKNSKKLEKCVKTTMEQACAPRLTLSVPLVVDIKISKNW